MSEILLGGYPSPEQFSAALLQGELDEVVETYLFDGTPYVFRDDPLAFSLLREHLGGRLGVPYEDIFVVGSGKVGFALSPDNYPRPFGDESDLDVVIVSEDLFDQFWMSFLRWNYPRRWRLYGRDLHWARARQTDLYWGWFSPTRIRYEGLSFPSALTSIRDFGFRWFDAFQSLSIYRELASREVSGRLYRTRHHAHLYHRSGFEILRKVISSSKEGG